MAFVKFSLLFHRRMAYMSKDFTEVSPFNKMLSIVLQSVRDHGIKKEIKLNFVLIIIIWFKIL